ncbi:MAG: hypothetical protein NZ455_09015 [Bacteroidia bacterium]|nr:hypothetical protein [Bacteroidia bacterium]MDW8346305.1 hypothetical protein [Bacteroidia bacterium]
MFWEYPFAALRTVLLHARSTPTRASARDTPKKLSSKKLLDLLCVI